MFQREFTIVRIVTWRLYLIEDNKNFYSISISLCIHGPKSNYWLVVLPGCPILGTKVYPICGPQKESSIKRCCAVPAAVGLYFPLTSIHTTLQIFKMSLLTNDWSDRNGFWIVFFEIGEMCTIKKLNFYEQNNAKIEKSHND